MVDGALSIKMFLATRHIHVFMSNLNVHVYSDNCRFRQNLPSFFHTTTSWHGNTFRINCPLTTGEWYRALIISDGSRNMLLNKQYSCRWIETPWCSCDVIVMRMRFCWSGYSSFITNHDHNTGSRYVGFFFSVLGHIWPKIVASQCYYKTLVNSEVKYVTLDNWRHWSGEASVPTATIFGIWL